MASKGGKLYCAKPGCRKWARNDGSGICLLHDPALQDQRREWSREMHKKWAEIPEDRRCGHDGCKKFKELYGNGYCYLHDPNSEKKQQARLKRIDTLRDKGWLPERMCKMEGCKSARLRNGSEFCTGHDPAVTEKRKNTKLKTVYPTERFCQVKGCRGWAMKDGTGHCVLHHKETNEKLRRSLKGNKHTKGRRLPWLGLKNFEEALGLIFYSLENDKPLLTLRALTKIASLHAHGQMYLPERKNEAENEEEEKEHSEMFYLDPPSWKE